MGKLDDEAIERKERRIPLAASLAFRAAMVETLKEGESVLAVEDGKLLRLFPNGNREFVKWIGRRVRIERRGKVPFLWQTTFPD